MCLYIYVCIYVGLCISVSLIYLSHPPVVIYLSANTFTYVDLLISLIYLSYSSVGDVSIYLCMYLCWSLHICISDLPISSFSSDLPICQYIYLCWSFNISDLSILLFSGGCVYISMYVSMLVFAYLYLWFIYLILLWWSTYLPIHLPMLIF